MVTYKILANTSSFKCVLSNVYFTNYYLKDHKFYHKSRNNMCKNTMSIYTALTIWLTGWLAPHTWAFTKRLECIVSKGVLSAGLRMDYQCERSSVHRTTEVPEVFCPDNFCLGKSPCEALIHKTIPLDKTILLKIPGDTTRFPYLLYYIL